MSTFIARCTALAALLAVATVGPRAPERVGDLTSASFPLALGALVQLVLLGLATWVLLVTVLALLGGSAGVLAQRLTPRLLRALLLAGLGGALAAGPAIAQDSAPTGGDTVSGTVLDGLVLPDRPRDTTERTPTPTPEVTVQPGDSLWSLASRHLGEEATPAEVAGAVDSWARLNRGVIGPDPDLIRPGQRLAIPAETPKDRS